MASNPEPDLEFERAHRSRQRKHALVIGLVLLGPVGWLVASEMRVASARREARLTAAQKLELAALLDRRAALARERVSRWNEAVQPGALAQLELGDAGCPLKLEPPTQSSAGAYVKFATHDSEFGAWPLCILRTDAGSPGCDRTHVVAPELEKLRSRIGDDDVYSWDLAEAKAAPPIEEPPGMVIVIDGEVRPQVRSGGVGRVVFDPGTLAGRSFVFAPDAGRIVCGGEVSVRNSKTVDIEYSHFGAGPAEQQSQAEYETRAALERDLEVHLRFAAPRTLRQAVLP